MNSITASVGMVAGLLISAGCNLTPEFQQPVVVTPEQWRHSDTAATAVVIEPNWWQRFGSSELNRLIQQALAANNDLAAAAQRVEQARAQAKIAGAALFPALGLSADYSGRHNEAGERKAKSASLAVAYEVDWWGANRAARDAGAARWQSEVFARDALQLVIMAEVGQAYFNLLGIQERKRIATVFLDNVNAVLAIVEARFKAGAVSALDVAQQKTERASAQANLDGLMQQQALAENVLAVLLGESPENLALNTELFSALQMPVLSMLQPGYLLQRRPDIRQQEMQLRAANAEVGVALAAFYPKLQLNLDAVLANPQPAGLALTMLAGLTQPVFQGGRLEGSLAQARARYAELIENYQQTLLLALKEVEDAAAIRRYASQRLFALTEAVTKAEEAYSLSLTRYQAGAVDYQTLLNTQRSLLTVQTNQVQARVDVLVAMVQLYKALGGGWIAGEFLKSEGGLVAK